MFANYKINITTLETGTTATTINIPINMDFQIVDQAELVERVFVNSEVEKAINTILDYEKTRFLPVNSLGAFLNQITYNIDLNGAADYAAIGFSDDDINFEKNNFKETFLNLSFYDTDNPLNQRLITNLTLFSHLTPSDLLPTTSSAGVMGQPKPANQIPLTFIVSSPLLNPRGFAEGYHLYDYKDEFKIGDFKYLYMRGSFKNAKTGKSVNLMVESSPSSIDNLVHKLYTRYKLYRTTTGFYYIIDDLYHGDGTSSSNNVIFSTNNVIINLYQIQAL